MQNGAAICYTEVNTEVAFSCVGESVSVDCSVEVYYIVHVDT